MVTHEDPDQDGAGAIRLILKKVGISIHQDRVFLHFVPHGTLFDPTTLPEERRPTDKDLVIHVDVGDKLDIENLIFDHHYEGCPYHSATAIIFDLLYLGGRYPPGQTTVALVELIDRIDSGHEVGDLDDEVYDTIHALNELLREEHGPVGRFEPNLPGPAWFMKLVNNRPTGTPDVIHLFMLIYALECYSQAGKHHFEMKTEFEQTVKPKLEIQDLGGLRLGFVPLNPFQPGELRTTMNNECHDEVDVMVAENTRFPNARGRFTVAIMSRKTSMVEGMKQLADALRTLTSNAAVYEDHRGFLIYVKEVGGLPLPFDFTGLRSLVATHLKRRLPQTGQAELDLHPAATEASLA